MLFNSVDFAIFLPIVFFIYWFVLNRNLNVQNLFIVIASFIFYAWWDWRFLSLLVISIVADFFAGKKIGTTETKNSRIFWLCISIGVNIGLLGFFKYYNFFVDNFIEAFSFFGKQINPRTLNIILPVGISFYTFQTLSYTIDVYKRKIEPINDMIAFSAFVSFFPQLVAGPIERATNLLPQFSKKRTFNDTKAVDGMRQILWGLFKKIVIADNCAYYADMIFNHYADYSGSVLLLGALLFAFQIYGDFSGYSDIAIGTARLFGIDLMRNFAFPYFSRDIAEFWRRWHISLTTWFRDYLYIPLGGSRGSAWIKIRNVMIIFIVSGFWHGANWTFIAWGAINAVLFIPLILLNKNRNNIDTVAEGRLIPSFKDFLAITLTFFTTTLAWIFFRAESITQAVAMVKGIFNKNLFSIPYILNHDTNSYVLPNALFLLIVIFLIVEWIGRDSEFAIEKLKGKNVLINWAVYLLIILVIFVFGGHKQQFIYFQF
ncbi:MAG: MBOAT family protein [Bacteroidetes bacterium]|nr:MBOAT family protein [Bacteroidota bacterium]